MYRRVSNVTIIKKAPFSRELEQMLFKNQQNTFVFVNFKLLFFPLFPSSLLFKSLERSHITIEVV